MPAEKLIVSGMPVAALSRADGQGRRARRAGATGRQDLPHHDRRHRLRRRRVAERRDPPFRITRCCACYPGPERGAAAGARGRLSWAGRADRAVHGSGAGLYARGRRAAEQGRRHLSSGTMLGVPLVHTMAIPGVGRKTPRSSRATTLSFFARSVDRRRALPARLPSMTRHVPNVCWPRRPPGCRATAQSELPLPSRHNEKRKQRPVRGTFLYRALIKYRFRPRSSVSASRGKSLRLPGD